MVETVNTPTGSVGVVIIGNNGGERFKRCIAAVQPQADYIVYVDSGSTDDSATWSRDQGVDVVEWKTDSFSAGGARNRGFERLHDQVPDLAYVQFLDGDCLTDPVWLATARAALDQAPQQAIASGRTREEQAQVSVYNRLSEMGWAKPIGPVEHCEGACLVRAAMFAAVGGYNPDLFGGEEIDLCHRLSLQGWSTVQLDAPMVDHDAEQTAFSQWWKRRVRRGASFARSATMSQGPAIHRLVRRTLFWTAGPLLVGLGGLVLGAMGLHSPGGTLLVGLALILAARLIWLSLRELRQGWTLAQALVYALAAFIEDWAHLWGLIRFKTKGK
ncbi:MAG: glycosyltransferase [Candidatus Latescibacteria bacterium]|nr:glycosyltransferase [Candidatus Latescibacterota bacterium]